MNTWILLSGIKAVSGFAVRQSEAHALSQLEQARCRYARATYEFSAAE